MKRMYLIIALSFLVLLGLWSYLNYFWLWMRVKDGGGSVRISRDGQQVYLKVMSVDSVLSISYLDNFVDDEKKEVYVWYYKKYYLMHSIKWNDEIKLGKDGNYAVYYRNPDWSKSFIRNLESIKP